jgi:hypothetical protein
VAFGAEVAWGKETRETTTGSCSIKITWVKDKGVLKILENFEQNPGF